MNSDTHQILRYDREYALRDFGSALPTISPNHASRVAIQRWGRAMSDSCLCLTPAELRELCGYSAHRAQYAWLQANRFAFVIDRCGRPRVLRGAVDARLGGLAAAEVNQPDVNGNRIGVEQRVRPDFSALGTAVVHSASRRRA